MTLGCVKTMTKTNQDTIIKSKRQHNRILFLRKMKRNQIKYNFNKMKMYRKQGQISKVKQACVSTQQKICKRKRNEAAQVSTGWVLVGTESTTCCTPRAVFFIYRIQGARAGGSPERLGTKAVTRNLRRRDPDTGPGRRNSRQR